ncbi:bromodomain-containing protein 4A [Aplysia californica]|uniref:Bromodomain-containing protein 4A n=1 Tax=Aplysia californica TaxID=6500 RepID=A0ABM0K525_APLCA|nr:bromodomain-containing protein 4A [Aplysia californica]
MSPEPMSPIAMSHALQQQQRFLQNEIEQHRQQLQQQQQQQQQEHLQYGDSNMENSMEKDQNSDSDSSGQQGGSEFSRRHRDLLPDDHKDGMYWERRRKNNESARKSREKRRVHDMALEGRICSLEDDNTKLRRELLALKKKFNLPESQPVIVEEESEEKASPPSRRVNVSPPRTKNQGQSAMLHSPVRGMSSKPSGPSHMAYNSPPPLLAVAGAMPMGVAMYPDSSPGLPYFMSESSRAGQEGVKSVMPSGLSHHRHQLPSRPQQQQQHHHHHHHQLPHPPLPVDVLKHEPMEEGEVRTRERSNSSVERRPSLHLDLPDTPMLRRGSVGSFPPYPHPSLSPHPVPSTQVSHHHHHHHHATPHTYPNPHLNPASGSSNPSHFFPRSYESYAPPPRPVRSPVSSHSSDDNYDEPLQLTVRRDSAVSNQSNQQHDDSSRESEPGCVMGGDNKPASVSPPASAFPLKLRHKLPSHELAYPKEMFPSMAATAAVSAAQPSFPTHPFMNGLAHLSDMALSQTNPLSLVKSENPPAPSHYGRQRKESSSRSALRRNSNETKYMDPKYLERRRRNNEAARKCRENRKALTKLREAKSDYLESENSKLRDELTSLQEEMKQLRELIEKKRLEQGIKEEPHAES